GCPMAWLGLLLFMVWIVGFPYHMIGLPKAPSRLRNWADRHRLEIVERWEPRFTWNGPFAGRTSSQALYRVVCVDDKGERRSAWVLCGSPLRGSWVDQVEVRWDEAGVAPSPNTLWFETLAGRRLLKTVGALGLCCLLLGPCLGLCIGLVMLLLT